MSRKDFFEFKEKMEIKHKVTFFKIPVPNNKNCSQNQNNNKITVTVTVTTYLCNYKTNGILECPCFLGCKEYSSNNKITYWGI